MNFYQGGYQGCAVVEAFALVWGVGLIILAGFSL